MCLAQMPYAALERPSIALGILKSLLNEADISSTTIYPSLWFAEEIGLDSYWGIVVGSGEDLIGEWTFSGAAFPEFQPDHEHYLSFAQELLKHTYGYSFLKKRVGRQRIVDHLWEIRNKAEVFVDQVARKVLRKEPRVVACTSSFQQHCASLALLRKVKEYDPSVITMIGGANTDSSMGVLTWYEFPWVDVVFSGEAEDVFVQMVRHLIKDGVDEMAEVGLEGVIAGKRTDTNRSALLSTTPRASIKNLNNSPLPDYTDFFGEIRRSKIGHYIRPTINIETSRGCWWGAKHHCTFCGLNGNGMAYRSKTSDRVVSEFAELKNLYGLSNFFTVDNIMDNAHIGSVLPVFETLPEKYSIFYETKANLKQQQVKQLSDAGVRWIQPGLESMHDSILKLIDKGTNVLINIQLLKWSMEFGIFVSWHFLHDVPGESDEWYHEMADWLPLLYHLQPPNGLTPVQIERFSPYHQRPANYGLKLVPQRAYAYVYPIDGESMNHFAYYFERMTDNDEGWNGSGREKRENHGLARLRSVINEWKLNWVRQQNGSRDCVELSYTDDGNELVVTDSRPCRVRNRIRLKDESYYIYKYCNSFKGVSNLREMLRKGHDMSLGAETAQEILDELVELKLMLHQNGRYIALAVPKSRKAMETEYAGGEVYIQQWLYDQNGSRSPEMPTRESLAGQSIFQAYSLVESGETTDGVGLKR